MLAFKMGKCYASMRKDHTIFHHGNFVLAFSVFYKKVGTYELTWQDVEKNASNLSIIFASLHNATM